MSHHHEHHRRREVFVARALPALMAPGLLLIGCGTTLTPAEMADQCAALAQDTAQAGLAGTPTREQAKAVADRLDSRLTELRDPRLHDAVVALHSHLHGVDAALRKGDTARAGKLTEQARDDLAEAAAICSLPRATFLGT